MSDNTVNDMSQYTHMCDNDCGRMLTETTPIMCYMNKEEGDLSLCNECYYDCEYYYDDENEDNFDEIDEHYEYLGRPGFRTQLKESIESVGAVPSAIAIRHGILTGADPLDLCDICGDDRGDHDVSHRNRLIPCESDGEWTPPSDKDIMLDELKKLHKHYKITTSGRIYSQVKFPKNKIVQYVYMFGGIIKYDLNPDLQFVHYEHYNPGERHYYRYKSYTVNELKKYLKQNGIKGYSGKKKVELIRMCMKF